MDDGKITRCATIVQMGPGGIKVVRGRASGKAFVGMQLRDGDLVTINGGPARLSWLDGNGTIEFARDAVFVIGPDPQDRPKGNQPAPKIGGVQLIRGVIDIFMPVDLDRDARDANGNIIKFKASTTSINTAIKGTRFRLGYDPQSQSSSVFVEEGTVWIGPKNPALRPFTLQAGQSVDVSLKSVSPVRGTATAVVTTDLTGDWFTGAMTIHLTQQGNVVQWNSSGFPGRPNLVERGWGTFDGRTFAGNYENREGNAAVEGRFVFTLNGNRLEGTVQTAAGASTTLVWTRK